MFMILTSLPLVFYYLFWIILATLVVDRFRILFMAINLCSNIFEHFLNIADKVVFLGKA